MRRKLSLGTASVKLKHLNLFCPNSLLEQAGPKLESLEAGLDTVWCVSGQWVQEQVAQVAPRLEPKPKARKTV